MRLGRAGGRLKDWTDGVKLELNIDGRLLTAEFEFGDGAARLTHDGAAREAAVSEPEPGLYTVILDGRVFRCSLERAPGGELEAVVNGRRLSVSVRDPKRARRGAGANAQGGGRATLVAPMPGKIVRVMRAAGDEVAAGDGILVVEAMKMQNEVQAPKAGHIAEIRVQEGQTVNAGEVLAVVE